MHFIRQREEDYFCAQVCRKAADWLQRNSAHKNFYLHLDIFNPQEPWNPPEDLLKQFDPNGYDVEGQATNGPYAPWRNTLSEAQFHNLRARYAAKVVFLDRQLGRIFDQLDALDLWKHTLVILTTDHGTFNGDHQRMGKLQTHEHDAKAHIPFIACHPHLAHGQRRAQLIQLVDLYPTVLAAVGRSLPDLPAAKPLHGVNLLPVFADPAAPTRDFALAGQFGKSVSLTDGEWILHQSPVPANQPLLWHGYHLARFLHCDLGPFANGVRPVSNESPWPTPTWLSDKHSDPNELINLAEDQPQQLKKMQSYLKQTLIDIKAPAEQLQRLGLEEL